MSTHLLSLLLLITATYVSSSPAGPNAGKPSQFGVPLAMTTVPDDAHLSEDKAFSTQDDHTHDPAGTVTIPFPPSTLSLTKPEEIKLPNFEVPPMPVLNDVAKKPSVDNKD